MKLSKLALSLIAAGALTLAPGVAPAANISIDDATDALTITPDGNFELGVVVTVSDKGASKLGLESGHVTGSFFTNSDLGTGGGIVLITEGANGPLSDMVAIQWTVEPNPTGGGFNVATINLDFVSDGEKGIPPAETTLPVLATLVESGDFQELAGVPKLVPANITIQFRSDVEQVPAPPVLALMLAGLLPLGWSYARRRS